MNKQENKLSFKTQFFYGVGELSGGIPSTLMVFFLLFFLTNVAGLNPALAGSVLLIGRLWDGINDPLIGWLSDRTQSSWGRRYPWMVLGAIPLGISFIFLWWIFPLESQWGKWTYYTLIVLLIYTAFTAVLLPYASLASELTSDYDERTRLISFKSAFAIGGSIFSLVLAQIIFKWVEHPEKQYFVLGCFSGILIIAAVYLSVIGTYPQYKKIQQKLPIPSFQSNFSLYEQLKFVFSNRPFLMIIGVYLGSWVAVQLTAAILPYYVVNWMNLEQGTATQMAIVVQVTAFVMVFVWSKVGQKLSKKAVYYLGVPLWLIAQVGFFFLQPGQEKIMYLLMIMAGFGVSTAYLVPWSILPDIIDLDELHTGQRREGIFYGFVVQIQKFGIAIALFLVGKILDLSGYIPHDATEVIPIQPDSALWAIRLIIAPVPTFALIMGLILIVYYPITRDVHQRILLQLREKRAMKQSRREPHSKNIDQAIE